MKEGRMTATGIGICGIGAVTAYGWGREALWQGLVEGKPAAVLLPGYGETSDDPGWVAPIPPSGDLRHGTSRFAQAVRAAADEAIEDAARRGWNPGRRVGVLHTPVLRDVRAWQAFNQSSRRQAGRREFLELMPSTPISMLQQDYGFHGPSMDVSAMCASGNTALIQAKLWLDNGIADDVLVIATDLSVTPEVVRGFVGAGVVVTDVEPLDACRPFQQGSRGFVMAEASAAFVMSRRPPDPYARILGGAMTSEGFHVISLDPTAALVEAAYAGALEDAGVDARAVRYLNAHGPGTRQCDAAESAAFDRLFPDTAELFSVKPLTGHCQAAAGLVEIAISCLGYERDLLPAPRAVAPGHPRLVDGPVRPADGLVLKSSLGMGGYDTAVVLEPPR